MQNSNSLLLLHCIFLGSNCRKCIGSIYNKLFQRHGKWIAHQSLGKTGTWAKNRTVLQILKTGSDQIIYCLGRYSFFLVFIMSNTWEVANWTFYQNIQSQTFWFFSLIKTQKERVSTKWINYLWTRLYCEQLRSTYGRILITLSSLFNLIQNVLGLFFFPFFFQFFFVKNERVTIFSFGGSTWWSHWRVL